MALFGGESREQLRRAYLEAWRKWRAGAVLSPLEAQIAAVIGDHAEYSGLLEQGEDALREDFAPERGAANPFLHMALHLAIRDQVATDRPSGIRAIHRRLAERLGDVHAAEHAMLEALGETLWEAQRVGVAPDERQYLERLAALPRR
jgi:hypothetical protein